MRLLDLGIIFGVTFHDSVFLFAGVVAFVQILVAVGLVVRWQGFALIFTQLVQGTRSHYHLVHAGGLVARAVEHVRGVLVVDDRLSHQVLLLVLDVLLLGGGGQRHQRRHGEKYDQCRLGGRFVGHVCAAHFSGLAKGFSQVPRWENARSV